MKSNLKKIVAFTVLAALSSLGFAKDSFGIYGGGPLTLFGGQYTMDDAAGKNTDVRINFGLFSAGVDVLMPLGSEEGAHAYWGAGVQTVLLLAYFPSVTIGYDWKGPFVEGNLVYAGALGANLRLGYNFQ